LDDDFTDEVADRASWPADILRARLSTALGEAEQTLRLLGGLVVSSDDRVIEIGAGLGLASAFLASCGCDVVAEEPAGVGFDDHASLIHPIAQALGSDVEVWTIRAEELSPIDSGRFSLAFSNNVLEHVGNVHSTIRALAGILEPDGLMVHSCPNYSVPFEPHFGLPLVPGRPRSTARLMPSAVRDSELWRSLNFVRARDIRTVADDLGMIVEFRSGALATSIERLLVDDEFRARHRLIGRVAGLITSTGAVEVIRRLPATWSTPMDFVLAPPDAASRIGEWTGEDR
jgi:2-polyprenyl-3-methyl-5-hydroxy-6-metoxy-1,4-benzoquinol methylase